eukprot:jgi/Galph1/2383/GphlegSOOS_G1032.1
MVDSQTVGILWTLVLGLVITCICLGLFSWLRQKVPNIYLFRHYASKLPIYVDYNNEPLYVPREPSNGMFSWIVSVWRYKEEKLFETYGLDAVMFLRFLSSSLMTLCILCLVTAAILYPVYATGARHHLKTTNPLYVSGFELISMSNLNQNDPRMWASMLMEYIVAIIICIQLFFDYRAYYRYRLRYRQQDRPCNYALLMVDLPRQQETISLARARMETIFKQSQPQLVCIHDSGRASKLKNELSKAVDKKERLEWKVVNKKMGTKKDDQPKMHSNHFGCIPYGNKVDALEYWNTLIEQKNLEFLQEREEAIESHCKQINACFVIFHDKSLAAFARQTCLWEETNQWLTLPAEDPKAIQWKAFTLSRRTMLVRRIFAIVAIVLLILFWSIPVTFVSGLANIRTLSQVKGFHWLSFTNNVSPTIVAFLDGMLPAIILVVFMSLVPVIIRKILLQTREFSLITIDKQVQQWYFAFLVVQVFFVYTIGGSAFGNLQAMIDNPSDIPNLLAQTIPKQALFYMNYIIVQGLIGFSISLLLLGAFIIRWFKLHFMAKTTRERNQVNNYAIGSFAYSTQYSVALVILFLCVMYSVLSPLILLFGVIYFAWGVCVVKYQLLYVYVAEYEAGGVHFPNIFQASIAAIVLQQVMMFGLYGINKFGPGFISVPLPLLTILYAWILCQRYGRISKEGAILSMIQSNTQHSFPSSTYSSLYQDPSWNISLELKSSGWSQSNSRRDECLSV